MITDHSANPNTIDLPAPELQTVRVTGLRISVDDWMAIIANLIVAQFLLALMVGIPCFMIAGIVFALTSD